MRKSLLILGFAILSAPLLIRCGSGLCPYGPCSSSAPSTPAPVTVTPFSKIGSFADDVYTLAITSDERVYIGGAFTVFATTAINYLVRILTSGEIDTTFNTGSGFNGDVNVVSLASDGSGDLYVGGAFTTYNSTASPRIIRLNSDGSIDTGFDTNAGFDSTVRTFAMATDGDIFVGGDFTEYDAITANNIIRLDSDGNEDGTFNNTTGFNGAVYSIVITTDGTGEIYAAGYFTQYKGSGSNRIIRIQPNGVTDTHFDVGTGFDSGIDSLAIAPENQLYVGGRAGFYQGNITTFLFRLNSNGTQDTAFSNGASCDSRVRKVLPTSGGKLYVGGDFRSCQGGSSNRIIRLNSNGSVDSSFDTTAGGFDTSMVYALAPSPSGRIYAGGDFSSYGGRPHSKFARIDSSGDLNAIGRFDSVGFSDQAVRTILVATDGSGNVYVGGNFESYLGEPQSQVMRMNSDGSPDSAFESGISGSSNLVFDIKPVQEGDANLYIAGSFSTYNSMGASGLIRVFSDGSLDTNFTTGTIFGGSAYSLVLMSDGSGDVYVGGQFVSINGGAALRIARLNSDGSRDTGFNSTTGFDAIVNSIVPALDSSGDIYATGNFSSYKGTGTSRLARLNSDGSLDSSFAVGTGFAGGFSNASHAVLVLTDGSGDILYVGDFTSYQGSTHNRIVRLNSDASVDTSFNNGSGGFNDTATNIMYVPDGSGDIYVTGYFITWKGASTPRGLIRLNMDGSADSVFTAIGEGFRNTAPWVIASSQDGTGDLFFGGFFREYDGKALRSFARISSSGELR